VAGGNGAEAGIGGPGAAANDFDAFGVVYGDPSGAVLAREIEIDAAAADAEAADVDAVEPVRKAWLDDMKAAPGGVGHEAEDRLEDLEDGPGGPGLGPAGDGVGHGRLAQGAGLAAE